MRFVFGLATLVALLFVIMPPSDDAVPSRPESPTVELPPEQERGDLEPVLINPTSGAAVRLWQDGQRIALHDFSPDGRWLVYTSFPESPGVVEASLYRIDLQTVDPRPELLTPGSWPTFSSLGHLAFIRWGNGDVIKTFVLTADGVIHEIASRGQPTSWSPDGRWLTLNEGYRGETADGDDIPMAQSIVDTTNWQEREYARSMPCHCDANPRPQWSPDSTRFLHSTLLGANPGERSFLTQIYAPDGRIPPVPAPGGQFWLDADRYVASDQNLQSPPPVTGRTSSIVDLASGRRTKVPGTDASYGRNSWSPDQTKIVTSNGVTTDIYDALGGTSIRSGLWGWPKEWSPDGLFLLTQSNETNCGPAVMVHRAADGEYLYCGAGSQSGAFSPDAAELAYLKAMANQPTLNAPHAIAVSDVYLMDLADGREHLLLADVRGYLCVFWSPDGRWLLISGCGGV